MKNMLKNLNLTAEEFLGPIGQFITILFGKNGIQWWEDFKMFLRKELMTFNHDIPFNLRHASSKPITVSFGKSLSPADIRNKLRNDGLRMGTELELISYIAFKTETDHENVSAMVLSHYGLENIPCAVLCSKHGCQFQIRIMCNQETANWGPRCLFLVLPISR